MLDAHGALDRARGAGGALRGGRRRRASLRRRRRRDRVRGRARVSARAARRGLRLRRAADRLRGALGGRRAARRRAARRRLAARAARADGRRLGRPHGALHRRVGRSAARRRRRGILRRGLRRLPRRARRARRRADAGARAVVVARSPGRLPIAVASNTREHDRARDARGERAAGRVRSRLHARSRGAAPKPAPDVYLAACEALGVAPAEAVAFEDSPPGAAAARAAGMFVIAVPSDGDPRARGRPRARLAARPRPGGPGLVSPPRVVCAPDKLRGALDAFEAAAALAEGVRRAGGEPLTCALADGGEGTLAVVCAAGAAKRDRGRRARRAGPPAAAPRSATAATARSWSRRPRPSASALLAPRERDPRQHRLGGPRRPAARRARRAGATHVLVGARRIGDGRRRPRPARRPGRARARRHGRGAARRARARSRARRARSSRACELSVLHDVDVPLCGPDGAAALFGPQKGLRREDIEPFDRALARLGEAFGGDVAERPGAGAAGGLGAALYALGAGARSGCEAVIELVGLRRSLAGAALCLTAEGSVDRQSARGKTVAGVLAACRDAGVPCIVLGGRVSEDAIAPLRALGALDVRAIGPARATARRGPGSRRHGAGAAAAAARRASPSGSSRRRSAPRARRAAARSARSPRSGGARRRPRRRARGTSRRRARRATRAPRRRR